MTTIWRTCIRDCYDNTRNIYYEVGYTYEFEAGDEMVESKHFVDQGKEPEPQEEQIRLDKALMRKSIKYLAKKHPTEAKGVDLRKKDAKKDLVLAIMRKEGTIKAEDEGVTMGERLDAEREKKLG